MLRTILIVILILLLIGALPSWPYSSGWGYYPGGGIALILVIVLILVLVDEYSGDHGPKFAQGKAPQAYGWYWSAFPRFCAAGTSRSCASMLR